MKSHLHIGNSLLKWGIISQNGQRDTLTGGNIKAGPLCTQQEKCMVAFEIWYKKSSCFHAPCMAE